MQSTPSPLVVCTAVGTSLRVALMDSATGGLEWRGAVEKLRGDVNYGAMHPSGRYLYVAVSDRALVNLVYAFSIDGQTGTLAQLGEPFALPPSLSRAVHITVDNTGRYLLMAHNVTESVGVLTLAPDGRIGGLVSQPPMPKLGFLVHQIRIDPTNNRVLVPVRGNDAQPPAPEQSGRMYLFSFNGGVLRQHQTIEYKSGIGPRHLDFHPTQPWVYVLAERGNVLITYKQDAAGLTELFRTSSLKDPSFKFPEQRAGAIHIHPNGRWLYVTNRNVAAGENNIALFSIDPSTGKPTLVEHTDSRGFEPRTFTLDPAGNFLIAGNMMNIARKEDDGRIADVQPNLSVFRIGTDGKLRFERTYDRTGEGQLWWVGALQLVAGGR